VGHYSNFWARGLFLFELPVTQGVPPWDTLRDRQLEKIEMVVSSLTLLTKRESMKDTIVTDTLYLRRMIDAGLTAVSSKLGETNPFKDSLSYLYSTGGKRLRPLLLLALQSDLCPDRALNIEIATAIELFHQASLLHDDLPALDDDDIRRGYPTVHIKFTEHEAVLLGDWLYGKAVSLVLDSKVDVDKRVQIASELAGLWCNICEGQELDMRNPQDLNSLRIVRFLKTSSFFEKIALIAALLSSVDLDAAYSISRWGREVGDLFQEVDDLLDREGQFDLKGRPYDSDRKNQKGTINLQFSTRKEYRELKEELSARLLSIHDSGFLLTREVLNMAFKSLDDSDY